MNYLKCLITGCGRSGTGFLANTIAQGGTPCGHENIFSPMGPVITSNLEFESSWYAVPYLTKIPEETKILHVVRNPKSVIESFHRIGLLSETIFPHLLMGRPKSFLFKLITKPRFCQDRLRFVLRHRKIFSNYPEIVNQKSELDRLQMYWLVWNKEIERFSKESGHPYLRIKIEEFEKEKEKISNFLNVSLVSHENTPRNYKQNYDRRPIRDFKLHTNVRKLACYYGY